MSKLYRDCKYTNIPLIFLLMLIVNTVMAERSQDDEVIKQRIDSYLTQSESKGFSGAMLVYKKGKIILNKGYGFANKIKRIKNTPNTVFDIGSVTKQFTATAILKLEQQQKLKVEQTLSHFFKQIPKDKKNITIHQLLTHTAGFVDGIGQNDFDMIPVDQYFKELFDTHLLQQPGSKYMYSNAGYSILARIIEIVSGQSYESYLNDNLFKPAGMKHTGYLLPNWQELSLANGYTYNVLNTGSMAQRYRTDGEISRVLLGNGGINSTQNDIFLWYQALSSGKIISHKLLKKLTTPYVLEFEGGDSYYTYGWVVYKSSRNTDIITHNGSNGTFFYDFIWFPNEEALILCANNSLAPNTWDIAWHVKKMFFDPAYNPQSISEDIVRMGLRFTEKVKVASGGLWLNIIKVISCIF